MTLFSVTKVAQARVLSQSGATTTRILHSSARNGRGITIGGGGGGRSDSGSSSKSGGPFSSLRNELNKEGTSNEKPPSTSQEARFDQIRKDSQSNMKPKTEIQDAIDQNSPSTSAEARLEFNKQTQKQEFQKPRDETWTAMSERIRLAQKEERNAEEEAKASVRKILKQRSLAAQNNQPRTEKVNNGLAERTYSFANTIEAQMFINGVTSTLLQESPRWQGSITLQRTLQGNETVEVQIAEGNEVLHSLDKLAQRFQSSASAGQSSIGGRRSQAFRSGSIAQATQSASVLSGEQDNSSLHDTIDGRVPVTIQGEQVPGNRQNDTIDARTADASHGPVGQVLGNSDSHSGSPIEEHTPVPNLHHQSRREFATLFGSGSGGLYLTPQSLTSIVGFNRRPSTSNAILSNQKRLLATSQFSIQLSQSTWSQIMNEREYVRVDDYIPIEIDPSQLGKKRSVISL